MRKLAAEFFGTFWLVLGGCGSAVLAAAFPEVGIGLLGVSLAFGLTVVTMAYAIGHISGCHLNPAVSIGLWAAGRLPGEKLLGYVLFQLLGAIVGGGALRDCKWQARFQHCQWLRHQRLWRTLAGWILHDCGARRGSR